MAELTWKPPSGGEPTAAGEDAFDAQVEKPSTKSGILGDACLGNRAGSPSKLFGERERTISTSYEAQRRLKAVRRS